MKDLSCAFPVAIDHNISLRLGFVWASFRLLKKMLFRPFLTLLPRFLPRFYGEYMLYNLGITPVAHYVAKFAL